MKREPAHLRANRKKREEGAGVMKIKTAPLVGGSCQEEKVLVYADYKVTWKGMGWRHLPRRCEKRLHREKDAMFPRKAWIENPTGGKKGMLDEPSEDKPIEKKKEL